MKFTILFFLTFLFFTMNAQNVGVGTSNPSDALHVEAEANKNALRVRVDGQTKLRVYANGGVAIGQNNASGTTANGLFVNGNTGLGVSSPQDRLVVDGNVDVMGEIKADGISGEEGQFLTPDGNGKMVWENLSDCKFTNARSFSNGFTGSWLVPADITLIKVELWGSGGTGGPPGGGGGGGYVCAFIKTVPGESFSYEVGDNVGNGDSKFFSPSNPVLQVTAREGQDATTTSPGFGGNFLIINSLDIGGYGIKGESGTTTTISYSQKSNTEYLESTKYGDGGAAPFGFRAGGSFILKNANTGVKLVDYRGRSGPNGTGGSGDENLNAGADGYIIVRW